MRTPIRDQLGLNDPEFQSSEATRREMRQREAAEKDNLRSGLAGLPAPTNEYQIMVPEVWPPDYSNVLMLWCCRPAMRCR